MQEETENKKLKNIYIQICKMGAFKHCCLYYFILFFCICFTVSYSYRSSSLANI